MVVGGGVRVTVAADDGGTRMVGVAGAFDGGAVDGGSDKGIAASSSSSSRRWDKFNTNGSPPAWREVGAVDGGGRDCGGMCGCGDGGCGAEVGDLIGVGGEMP